jgi:hypothetical protein
MHVERFRSWFQYGESALEITRALIDKSEIPTWHSDGHPVKAGKQVSRKIRQTLDITADGR